jgi:hypothetical protein
MELAQLKEAVPGLSDKSHYEKIKVFGWWLHVHRSKPSFTGADINQCYTRLHFSAPSSFGAYIKQLAEKKTLLKAGERRYKLENKSREQLDAAYGQSETTIKIKNLLTGLADTIPDLAERTYYKEALICYKYGSMRAAVVMTWNVTFSHLCDHVLAKRLNDFNARWQLSFAGMHKKKVRAITAFDDFNEELKESEVLTICRDAGIITKYIYNIMDACLSKRNAAAHPNDIVIDSAQADAFISDLIQNVVLKIA